MYYLLAKKHITLAAANVIAMNKLIVFSLLTLLFFTDCRKSSDPPLLTSIITQGSWYVNLMKQNNVNQTAAYANWQFTFKADKGMVVTNGVDTYTGTWSEDEAKDKFILNIASPEIELINISQEWDISLKTFGRVIFKDDNFNPKEELQFTKF